MTRRTLENPLRYSIAPAHSLVPSIVPDELCVSNQGPIIDVHRPQAALLHVDGSDISLDHCSHSETLPYATYRIPCAAQFIYYFDRPCPFLLVSLAPLDTRCQSLGRTCLVQEPCINQPRAVCRRVVNAQRTFTSRLHFTSVRMARDCWFVACP